MTWPIPDLKAGLAQLNFSSGRIGESDALRQHRSVRTVLDRLAGQPGIVLADEVGMGKTFVALGAAYVAAQQDRGRNPVVVMIPPSLRDKWPRDAEVFATHCVAGGAPALRFASAPTALDFFRLLDDTAKKRAQVIFLHHGAFHLQRIDHWTKLALMARAMHAMKLGEKRTALPRYAGDILRVKSVHRDPDLYASLLSARYEDWKDVINRHYADRPDRQVTDDPIPERVIHVLERKELDLQNLRDAIRGLPARYSTYIESRLQTARNELQAGLKLVWPQVLKEARFRSPLLVLDEAHHLKNSETRLASLFSQESLEDADMLAGAFRARFERMLFLTATPFQLGHAELVNVLSRFAAVEWRTLPKSCLQQYETTLRELSESLDRAQQIATELDRLWQRIPAAVAPASLDDTALNDWWHKVISMGDQDASALAAVARSYQATRQAMLQAERLLRPWIIRHLRTRALPDSSVLRRMRMVGRSVVPGCEGEHEGIEVTSDQLLPFLLAARAQSVAERLSRLARERYLTFSEGLASSYEAFLETSKPAEAPAVDDARSVAVANDALLQSYIGRLKRVLPAPPAYGRHPKIDAVINRVVSLWSRGEKVVIFCHYRKTGQALVRHLSTAVEKRLWSDLSERTGVPISEAPAAVERFGGRFDPGAPMARFLGTAVQRLVSEQATITPDEAIRLQDIVRRFVRSPIFVARYFDPTEESSEALMDNALATTDGSGLSLYQRLQAFVRFYASRDSAEREQYLDALEHVQPGGRGERLNDGEDSEVARSLLPNIRLANGATRQDARQRLMLSFNTPFFPDILVASSVLAEGVDLHLNCRHVIHHDLSWNPSDIEQRTGRVDRLGSKAEQVKQSVEVYLPFVAETQDEKQFKVVVDRERWFQVLMGEDYRLDDTSDDAAVTRIPLPPAAGQKLAFKLEA